MSDLLFVVGWSAAGAVVGWLGTPLVWVPWQFVRAQLRRTRRPA